jgi:hypothetical protein
VTGWHDLTDARQSFAGAQHILALLIVRHAVVRAMVPGVKRQLMATGDRPSDEIWPLFRHTPDPTKRRLHLRIGKEVEDAFSSNGIIRGLRDPVGVIRLAIIRFPVPAIDIERQA